MKHLHNCVTNVWLTLWLRKYFSIKGDSAKFTRSLLWPLWKVHHLESIELYVKYHGTVMFQMVIPWYCNCFLVYQGIPRIKFQNSTMVHAKTIVCRSKIHVIWYFWYLYFVLYYLKVWLVKLSYFQKSLLSSYPQGCIYLTKKQ